MKKGCRNYYLILFLIIIVFMLLPLFVSAEINFYEKQKVSGKKGWLIFSKTIETEDYCINNYFLREYYLENEKIKTVDKRCQCKDGRCVKEIAELKYENYFFALANFFNLKWLADLTFGKTSVYGGCISSADCNDNNECTNDICTGYGCEHAQIPGCQNDPCDGINCDDGDECTNDICTGYGCEHALIPGCGEDPCSGINCDDNNKCTTDSCNNGDCVNLPIQGCGESCEEDVDCDDDNVCNGYGYCVSGNCESEAPLDCNDNIACSTDTCDPIDGCSNVFDDSLCDDGNPCNGDEICDSSYGCVSVNENPCNDFDSCTIDSCDPLTGCSHEDMECPLGYECTSSGCVQTDCVSCEDCDNFFTSCDYEKCNYQCNMQDSCYYFGERPFSEDCVDLGTACISILRCEDYTSEECEADNCDLQSNTGYTMLGCGLDENNECFTIPYCGDGVCEADENEDCYFCPEDCSCEEGYCSSSGASIGKCVECTQDEQCDDGNICNGMESCINNNCSESGITLNCNDGLDCTLDSCNNGLGCVYTPDDNSCNDGNICNGFEACNIQQGCIAANPLDFDEGLVLKLNFDNNNSFDSSGKDNHGIARGARWNPNQNGGEFYFDGINDYIFIRDDTSFTLSEGYTFLAWVNTNKLEGQAIISQWGDAGEGNAAWHFGIGNGGYIGISNYNGISALGTSQFSDSRIETEEWNHVAAVYTGGNNGTNLFFYINGLNAGSKTITQIPQDSNYDVTIGAQANNYIVPFDGIIDEVKIWNRALSASEIESLYTNDFEGLSCSDNIECTLDTCDEFNGCSNIPDNNSCDDGIGCTLDICTESGCLHEISNESCNDNSNCTLDICEPDNMFSDGNGCRHETVFCLLQLIHKFLFDQP